MKKEAIITVDGTKVLIEQANEILIDAFRDYLDLTSALVEHLTDLHEKNVNERNFRRQFMVVSDLLWFKTNLLKNEILYYTGEQNESLYDNGFLEEIYGEDDNGDTSIPE